MIRGISRLAEVFLEDFAPWIWVVVNHTAFTTIVGIVSLLRGLPTFSVVF